MYKDKQREADRERQQRRRDRIKIKGVTNKESIVTPFVESPGITQGMTEIMADKGRTLVVSDAEHERLTKPKRGKPGDADYNGICTKEWRAERDR